MVTKMMDHIIVQKSLVFLPYNTNDKGILGMLYERCRKGLISISACIVKQ